MRVGRQFFMQNAVLFMSLLFVSVFSSCRTKPVYSSFNPGKPWLDNNGVHINAHGGGIALVEGVYYWFGTHMTEGENGYLADVGVHCYSSKDLYNWKDEGIALRVDPEGSGSPIEKGCILERPKVIYNKKTNKYVMWFHLEPKGLGYRGAQSGVAVSDHVTGPYKFVHAGRVNAGKWALNTPDRMKKMPLPKLEKSYSGGSLPQHPDTMNIHKRDFEKGQMARDMNLFVDDDGRAYHIYSSEENSTLHIAQLTDDYMSHNGLYVRCFVGRFMEAPAMFKYKGKYYLMMSGCTSWDPNAARSAMADSIFGEWKELGNPCVDNDSALTYHSQSTYILPVPGNENKFIYMGDRWTPENAINASHIWLPIEFDGDRFIIPWREEWKL